MENGLSINLYDVFYAEKDGVKRESEFDLDKMRERLFQYGIQKYLLLALRSLRFSQHYGMR